MGDAMTWGEVRRRVLRMMRDARREEASAFHELSAREHAADAAALTHALAALDAVERVREMHATMYGADSLTGEPFALCPYCGRLDHYDAYEGTGDKCPTIRALDGEADR